MSTYRISRARNELIVAFPAIFVFFARAESTTAPSIPMNVHTVVVTVPFTCVSSEGLSAAPAKFSMNMEGLNAPIRMIAKTVKMIGTSLAITTTALMPTAEFTPRYTSRIRNHT